MIRLLVAAVLLFASYASANSEMTRPPGSVIIHPPGWHLPKCFIQNPPYSPVRRPDSDIVIAVVRNKCEQPVWLLGAFICLQARNNWHHRWENVWCESNQVYFKAGLTVWADCVGVPLKKGFWEWRSQAYAYVTYEPGGEVEPSPTLTSAYVPLRVKPLWTEEIADYCLRS